MNKPSIPHNEDNLILSRRQSSLLVAAAIFVAFFIFTLGYFLGTKHATDEFVAQVNQETFADQIFASVHSLSKEKDKKATAAVESAEVPAAVALTQPIQGVSPEASVSVTTLADQTVHHYAAELIGFGTEKAAQQFIDRVAKTATINLELRKRVNTNRRGKAITWYQVVTKRYADRAELDELLATITKTEKLHDINIVPC